MYRIAIAGASTLLGKELKEALSESTMAAANFVLLDEDEALGTLDQVGDEVTFVQPIVPEAFEKTDFTFFCSSAELTREALEAGAYGGVFGARSFGSVGPGDGRAGASAMDWDGVRKR